MKPSHATLGVFLAGALVGCILSTVGDGGPASTASAQDQAPHDDDLPRGRTASAIEAGAYPTSYFPNTEELGAGVVRVVELRLDELHREHGGRGARGSEYGSAEISPAPGG